MDGPFFSLLPLGSHGRYLLIHVEKSVIFDSIGKFAPPEWFNIKEFASRPADFHNWFADLIESCVRFVPSLQHARLIDVFEQPRMVLANKELTDERQSLVQAHDGYISVFSGKSDHSVWVADQVFDLVRAHLMHACDPSYLLDENTQK